jgi:hypothetical protein
MITLGGECGFVVLDALARELTKEGIPHGALISEYERGERATPYSAGFPSGYLYYLEVDVDTNDPAAKMRLAAIVERVNAAHPHLTPVTDYRVTGLHASPRTPGLARAESPERGAAI